MLLFEHKSYLVSYPTLQLADYIFSILRNNVKNGTPLSLVIPIIFYHGEKPWKYKDLKSHYQGIDEDLERYIPNFDYHVIDLTQYSDENILSLKMSFLINSLIAFKHKNDSEYVKQQAERIFHHLEIYANSDYTQLFFRSLAIYIMSSTKLTGQEMGQIIDTLPKKDREKMKSTYENIIDMGIDMGIEKGIFIGKKRGEELSKLKLTFDAIKIGMETVFITQFLGVSEKLIKLIKWNLDKNFESEDLAMVLVSELLMDFQYLGNDDIADFCNVSIERVEHLRKGLLDEEV